MTNIIPFLFFPLLAHSLVATEAGTPHASVCMFVAEPGNENAIKFPIAAVTSIYMYADVDYRYL
jgi:hypothetical protein